MTRRRRPRYRAVNWRTLAVVAAVAAVLVLLEHAGLLQTGRDDLQRYDGQSFVVASHVDGDTFRLAAPDRRKATTTVRLWGVDTPETRKPNTPVQHYGPEASAFTRRTVGQGPVRLRLVPGETRDRYDRLLAYVYLPDGRMLNALLVEQGYAYADPRYGHPHAVEFERAMRLARRQGWGLWAEVEPEELPYYLESRGPAR